VFPSRCDELKVAQFRCLSLSDPDGYKRNNSISAARAIRPFGWLFRRLTGVIKKGKEKDPDETFSHPRFLLKEEKNTEEIDCVSKRNPCFHERIAKENYNTSLTVSHPVLATLTPTRLCFIRNFSGALKGAILLAVVCVRKSVWFETIDALNLSYLLHS
jgi:hypothetical protein